MRFVGLIEEVTMTSSPTSLSLGNSPVFFFFSDNLILSVLKFRALINLQLILMRCRSCFSCTICQRDLFSSLWSRHFSKKNQLFLCVWIDFWTTIFCSSVYWFICQNKAVLIMLASQYVLKLSIVIHSTCFFYSRIVLLFLVFVAPYAFKNYFFNSEGGVHWILDWLF